MNGLDRERTALVVIDMQNGFCHDQGALAKAGIDMSRQRAIVPRVKELVELARKSRLPILWSKQEHYREDLTRKRRRIPSHLDRRNVFPCLRGTWDEEIVEDLRSEVKPEDHVFVKHRSSCFFDTPLDTKLRMLGIDSLIISGVATNYCVESTVRDAYARDYDICVAEECVASSFPDLHEATLKNVRVYYGMVISLGDLKTLFSR